MARGMGRRQLSVELSFELVSKQHQSILDLMQNRSLHDLQGQNEESSQERRASKRSSVDLRNMLTHLCAESRRGFGTGTGTAGSDGPPDRTKSSFDIDLENVDEQRREFEYFQNLNNLKEGELLAATHEDHDSNEDEVKAEEETAEASESSEQEEGAMIEVAPGMKVPLRTSAETWNALLEGRITVTRCSNCSNELTCLEDADLVICVDCWVCSPVDQSIPNLQLEGNTRCSACIGMKTEDVFEWLASQEQL
jgi:uncharacterized protein (DUF2249 family)